MAPDNEYLPHNYTTDNSIVYIGTHDNETLVGALVGLTEEQQERVAEYYDARNPFDIARAMIKRAYSLNCRVAIFQTQDLLYLDNDARMNFPSTVGNNWKWRISSNMLPKEVMDKIYDMAIISDRLSYQCQHLEWLKKEEKRKAKEEAKAKENVKTEEKAKKETKTEVKAKEVVKKDAETKEDKENQQLSFQWS